MTQKKVEPRRGHSKGREKARYKTNSRVADRKIDGTFIRQLCSHNPTFICSLTSQAQKLASMRKRCMGKYGQDGMMT